MLDIPFRTVDIQEMEEVFSEDLPAEEVPKHLSKLKALAYLDTLKDDDILITADTIVSLGNKILGKPSSLGEAKQMLFELSGKRHKVITGITLTTRKTSVTFSCTTEVKFSNLSKDAIAYYVNHYKPLDKAGAYGIQEWIGAVGIESIEGSYYNVMGLPVHMLYRELLPFIQ